MVTRQSLNQRVNPARRGRQKCNEKCARRAKERNRRKACKKGWKR